METRDVRHDRYPPLQAPRWPRLGRYRTGGGGLARGFSGGDAMGGLQTFGRLPCRAHAMQARPSADGQVGNRADQGDAG